MSLHCFVKKSASLGNSRDSFHEEPRPRTCVLFANFFFRFGPERRHLNIKLTIHVRGQKGSFNISSRSFFAAKASSALTVGCFATGAKVSLKLMPHFINCPRMTTLALNCLLSRLAKSTAPPRCFILKTQSVGTGQAAILRHNITKCFVLCVTVLFAVHCKKPLCFQWRPQSLIRIPGTVMF